jgi:hypothetical protein
MEVARANRRCRCGCNPHHETAAAQLWSLGGSCVHKVKKQYISLFLMKLLLKKPAFIRVSQILEICFALMIVCSCSKPKQNLTPEMVDVVKIIQTAQTNEFYIDTSMATKALYDMLKGKTLPGVSEGEHGKVTSDEIHAMISNNWVKIEYPFYQTQHLVKTGDTSTNNYVMEQSAKGATWHLIKAWQTDSNGQIIKEWPLK